MAGARMAGARMIYSMSGVPDPYCECRECFLQHAQVFGDFYGSAYDQYWEDTQYELMAWGQTYAV